MSRNGTATLTRNEGLAGVIAEHGAIISAKLSGIGPSDIAWVVAEAARLCVERKKYHSAVNILVDGYRSRHEMRLSEDHSEELLNRAREAREQGGLGNVHADLLGKYRGAYRR